MKAGLMTTGLTNCPTGGEPAVQDHFCANAAAEAAALGPNGCADGAPNADSWRAEVAARLERYRARRKPRSPRYPSLLLPFDATESWSRPAPPPASEAVAPGTTRAEIDFAFQTNEDPAAVAAPSPAEARQTSQQTSETSQEQSPYRYPERVPEQSAKVIEFPRSAAIPVFHTNDLADPVFDRNRPRIVEVPEILPPPPTLGGMLIEAAQQEPADRRASADFPLPSASISRRVLAVFVDGVILATALNLGG